MKVEQRIIDTHIVDYIFSITELKRFSGHPLSNDIDRQLFGIPIPVLFALALSVVAFGGVAGQAGVFDAISDLISTF